MLPSLVVNSICCRGQISLTDKALRRYRLLDPAAGAGKRVMSRVGPGGQRQSQRFGFRTMLGAIMLPFSIFRAAMFAEPTVTKIEEVVRLVHVSRTDIPVCLCDATSLLRTTDL